MAWLSGSNKRSSHRFPRFWPDKSPPQTLQILSYETAKAMSRLLALYQFLSDDEFSKLRNGLLKSGGVTYLNSIDERYLLNLACSEKLEELNSIATTVSRLAQKCSDSSLKRFHLVFPNLQQGILATDKIDYNSGTAEKLIRKIDKYVSATSNFYQASELLAEMELSQRKLRLWKLNAGPSKLNQRINHVHFEEKLAFQRKQVNTYREKSLWNKTFNKIVRLMAQIICAISVRICDLFCSFIPSLPLFIRSVVHDISCPKMKDIKIHPELDYCDIADQHKYIQQRGFYSGPIPKSSRKSHPTRFHSQELVSINMKRKEISGETETNKRVIQLAPPSTLGAAGLASRYANIIVLVDNQLNSPVNINDDTRGYMYDLLPASLKATVRGKLRSRWNKEQENDDHALAEGWRDALEEILRWLAPMAHNTLAWQAERNSEKQRFDVKPKVLLLQTLYFSDLEKTEAAIVDVLVGLSCIYRYENRRCRTAGLGDAGCVRLPCR